jgi:hypothetical protein
MTPPGIENEHRSSLMEKADSVQFARLPFACVLALKACHTQRMRYEAANHPVPAARLQAMPSRHG